MMKIKAANIWPQTIDEVIFGREELDEYSGRILIDDQGQERVLITVEFKQRFDFKVRRWTDERQKGLQRVKFTITN